MEELIREGALRLLTSESSCDVILSCRGYRLMAHKVILSIASPVFQELLRHDDTVPTVMIFPDISGSTMSLILDYIYSGCVNIRSDILGDFMIVANELKLKIDPDSFKARKCLKTSIEEIIKPDCKYNANKLECDTKSILDGDKYKCNNSNSICSITLAKINHSEINRLAKKCPRKMPGLLPLTKMKRKKILCNHITPSPWRPRIAPLLEDPRENHLSTRVSEKPDKNVDMKRKERFLSHQSKGDTKRNDKNNNFAIRNIIETTSSCREHRYDDGTKSNSARESVTAAQPGSDAESDMLSDRSVSTDEEKNPLVPLDMKKNSVNYNEIDSIGFDSKKSKASKTESRRNSQGEGDDGSVVRSRRCDGSSPRKDENKKPFNCDDCGKSFSQLRNFKYHRSIHEGTKEFSARCPECGKTFNDKGYLSSHLKIHRDRKEYGCPHCPKRFNQRVAYNMHLRIHTGVKPHECPTCGKTFSRKMLLKQHQRVHTGERPYSCPECGKSFADRSNMSLHARLHTGVKPYTCNLCSKSFTKKHHLKTHMNFHTGLKPYSCEKCGLAFSQSSNMRTHYKKCILKPANTSENENT